MRQLLSWLCPTAVTAVPFETSTALLMCRYALVKVGTVDGKLRLVTQSEVRRVRRRIGGPVTSPGANGRSRRVAADPEEEFGAQLAPAPVSGTAAAAISASLQAPCSRAQQMFGDVQEPTPCPAIGQGGKPVPTAVEAGAGGSFSEQLNAALRAVHTPDVPPAWLPMLRATAEINLPVSQQVRTGGLAATAMVAMSDVESGPESRDGTVLPPLHQGIHAHAAAREVPPRSKGSRSRQKAATRQQDGQLPTGTTNRGRVRQRGSKRAELLHVGKLR